MSSGWLAVAKLAMGYPLTIGAVAISVLAVRRVRKIEAAEAAEAELVGHELGEAVASRAARAALAGAQPLEHNAYKLPLAEALIRQALAASRILRAL